MKKLLAALLFLLITACGSNNTPFDDGIAPGSAAVKKDMLVSNLTPTSIILDHLVPKTVTVTFDATGIDGAMTGYLNLYDGPTFTAAFLTGGAAPVSNPTGSVDATGLVLTVNIDTASLGSVANGSCRFAIVTDKISNWLPCTWNVI